ncbi:PucR family transcriptional regulator ligand-binding domain-containing protein [Mycolicibacterium sp. P9-64]|uniref:PucR family transcriptional regulator n=1 Tax=Mycolicibacterium sp. P9-64 TaxID=2024612 RepID=UPI003221AF94
MTVGGLASMRQLGCQAIAGMGGLDRRVVWAHSCELEDPWNWLSSGELLMTTGICVPSDERAQVELIQNLFKAGIAGIAIGDDFRAPPLHQGMLAEADALDFPILTVTHSTPFAALGRTVAVASQSEQISRIARLSRLYEVARSATLTESSLLERLSVEFGFRLHVVDVEFGTELLARGDRLDSETVRELCRLVAGQLDRLPPRLSVVIRDELAATGFSLSTHRKCVLVAGGAAEIDVDAFGLLHAQSLISIEVERVSRDRERDDESGADLFGRIIDGTLGSDAATPRLERAGLPGGVRIVISFDAAHLRTVRIMLGDLEYKNVSCTIGEEGYALLAAKDGDAVAELLGSHVPHVGISATTASVQRLADSVRQARWALQAAHADGAAVAEYSTAAPLFLPRTLTEAEFASRAVLGELMDHDESHQSQLVETLEVFLTSDRSWSLTAEKLVIHRQTLGYRLKKIEALTERSTKSSADIATLWMALVARRISRGGLH